MTRQRDVIKKLAFLVDRQTPITMPKLAHIWV
jgi:hypothetical protein